MRREAPKTHPVITTLAIEEVLPKRDLIIKRPKFRTLDTIIKSLISWRHLYNGVYEKEENGETSIYSYSL